MFQYLYCHSSGFIDWFCSVVLKLSRSELFKSMIFNFFAVLLLSFFISTICLFACFLVTLLSAASVLLMLLYCLTHFLSLFCISIVFAVFSVSIMIHMYILADLAFFCFFNSYLYILAALFVLQLIWVQPVVNIVCTWMCNASRFLHLFMSN